jgi:hypothetical protein
MSNLNEIITFGVKFNLSEIKWNNILEGMSENTDQFHILDNFVKNAVGRFEITQSEMWKFNEYMIVAKDFGNSLSFDEMADFIQSWKQSEQYEQLHALMNVLGISFHTLSFYPIAWA